MSQITSHVLDIALGLPVRGLEVTLSFLQGESWQVLGRDTTDKDGRAKGLLPGQALTPGVYRLAFETATYFAASARASFYERVEIQFRVSDASEQYHVPLLLSPFGYTTYRGS